MVKITGRGVAAGMRNLMAMREADRQEKNRKEEVLMGIFAKYGVSGLNGLFPGEDVSKEALNTDLEDDSLTDTSSFSQTLSETNAMKKLARSREDDGYGLDQTTIAAIKANGDPTAFKRLYEMVDKKAKYFQERGQELPLDYLRTVVDQAVMTSASPSGKINFKKMEDYVGRELDDLSKAIIMQASEAQNRGEILFTDVNYAERPSLEEMAKLPQIVLSGSHTRAQSERRKIIKEQAKLNKKEGLLDLKGWMTERIAKLNNAIENYENKDYYAVASLYGTESLNKILENYGEFEQVISSADPAIQQEAETVTVPNRMVAEQLVNMGILEAGDEVFNQATNKLIKIE
tara:strand:+ start:1708 stop:2745 length:1038 start_codon:yes stop_codon:yes gene_type:complete